jgi:Cytochrome C oxidase, cbb3-type, subunit III
VIAATSTAGILLLVLGALLATLSAAVLSLRHRARGEETEIPHTMRPGPSDAALETPLLHRLQGWGVVLVVFFVAWFPIQWLFEPGRNLQQEEDLKSVAIERGSLAVLPFSEENQLGVGCVRCHGAELQGGVIPYQGGYAQPPNLQTICGGNLVNPPHTAIVSVDDIYQVIMQGRGAMPSWSIRFAGALTDQQINDIVMYLIDMSSQHVDPSQNICTNADAMKAAADKAALDGTVTERP